MRYAVIEFHGLRPNRKHIQTYRDLSFTSANDLVRAWNVLNEYRDTKYSVSKDRDDWVVYLHNKPNSKGIVHKVFKSKQEADDFLSRNQKYL